ncbi:MAG: DnaD domain protein [Lachnospiraceae bacterium]|nr:DnaD domain protein [Lachnospiraceae bacterium]
MSIIKLYTEDCDPGVTLISNVFIDYYLKDANDAQLKIYLYLIRHISNHKPFEISNIADEFNFTESDVMRSLKYWEQKQILSLDYNSSNTLTGIELHNVDEELINPRDNVHMFAVPSFRENESAENAKNPFPETKFTATDLLEMSKDENWLTIKSIAESYLERTLSANDLQVLAHIYKDFDFKPSDVDSLFEKCLTQGKKSMRSIKKVAEEEYASNIINPSVNAIMNALGTNGAPSQEELSYINRWLSEMNLELILEGCRKAKMSTSGNRIKYANGIFNNWKSEGIKTIDDMAKAEESYRMNRDLPKKQPVSSKQNTRSSSSNDIYKQYKHGNYDFDALEREIRSN